MSITQQEIARAAEHVHALSEEETACLVAQLEREQPTLHAFIGMLTQGELFEEPEDIDAFLNLSAIIWCVMRAAADTALPPISSEHLEGQQTQMLRLYAYAQGEAEAGWSRMMQLWLEGCPQPELIGFLVQTLVGPENPYKVSNNGSGILFTYLNVLVACLDQALQALQPMPPGMTRTNE